MRLPPLHWWRTVLYLIPAVSLYTVGCGVASLGSTLVDRRGHAAHRWARRWARLILATTGVTVELGGALPSADASRVFVANHASIYDIPIVFTALPFQLRIMAKDTLGRIPFLGWHLRRAGHVLVDRANPGAGIFKRMRRMVQQGASLIVFPEGSRSTDGAIGRFKGGVFLLAIENGLPVVPITVVNSWNVMRKGELTVRPATVTVVVHDPIPTAGLTREDARALAERTRAVVASGLPPARASLSRN